MRVSLLLALLLSLLPTMGHAIIRSVPGVYPTIQAAVDACAEFGDVVEVGPGYYSETVQVVSKAIFFQPAAGQPIAGVVQVDRFEWNMAGGGIRSFEILDGILATDTRKRIFSLFDCSVHGDVEVRGMEFSCSIDDCVFDGGVVVSDEGFGTSTWATVDRCVFNGGSLFLEVRFPTVSRSQFTDASIGILGSSGYASNNVVVNGGIWVISDGSGVDIAGNSLSGGIGGIWAHSTKGANVTVQENDLRNCGGIRVTTTPGMPGMTAKITGNVLCNSSTGIDFPDDWGWREIRSNTITGCAGSGFSLAGRALASDLFTQNISSENAVGVQVSYTPAPGTFHCNDVWNNPGGNWVGIADPTGTDDNIAEDPEFCSPVDCDLTLQTGSPCLPDGSPCALQIGARGKGACSLTVTAPSTWGAVKVRYR